MPVREFTGELDQPKVKEFTGTLDRSIAPGSPEALAMSHPIPPNYASGVVMVGPSPDYTPEQEAEINRQFREAVHKKAMDIEAENTMFLERNSVQKKMLPLLSAGIGAMAPGGLAISSIAAGLMGGTGELASQRISGDQPDLGAALKEAKDSAIGNFAGGTVLKGLGYAAKKLFSSPLSESQKAGALFAKDKELPFPLSSAAPGSRAGLIQQGSRTGLLGELRTQADANKVAQFLNREVSSIQAEGSPIDEAAMKGQQFLRKVFEPGESVYTDTFTQLREAIGDNTPIALTNTASVLPGVAEALKTRGATGALVQQIQTLAKRNPTELTAKQLDDLYGELLKKAGKNPNARAEMNVVLDALAKDADTVGKDFNYSFYDELNSAKKVRDSYRDLRNIPGLERLSKEFGDKGGTFGSRQWMTELFGNPNGKALSEIRKQNPELYHELADSWLANNISQFSKSTDAGIGRALDGKSLREWYEKNASNIKVILGAPQAQALDNFTNYAELMSGATRRANQGSTFTPGNLVPRIASTVAGMKYAPYIMAPTEGGSYVLAKGLSDPNSTLFKLFTEGVSPKKLDFIRVSSYLSGQEAARASD